MKGKSTATGLLTLLALVVLGAVSAGSASAESFLWTGPLPGLVLVLSENIQAFTAAAGLEIQCEHFGGHGILSNGPKGMSTKEVTITGNYTKCKAGGFFNATVSPAEFLVNANGSLSIVGKPIVVTVPTLECSLKINNDGANANLKTLRFLNLLASGDIQTHAEVTKITSLGSTATKTCGEPGVEKTEGTYRGLFLIFLDGGTVKWDA